MCPQHSSLPAHSCKSPQSALQPILRTFLFLPSITPSQLYNLLHTQCVWRRRVKLIGHSWCVETVHPPSPLPTNKNLHFLHWALACNTAILACWYLPVFLSSICHFFCPVFLTIFAQTHKAGSFGFNTTDQSSVSTFTRELSQMPPQLVINHRIGKITMVMVMTMVITMTKMMMMMTLVQSKEKKDQCQWWLQRHWRGS